MEIDRFKIYNKYHMKLASSDSDKYGGFLIPDEAHKLIEEHHEWPFPYTLYAEHESKGLWWKYDEDAKQAFLKEMSEGKVKWSNPNKQCKHCGRIFDPAYEFIEDEDLLAFCMDEHGDYKYPNYCPSCIQELYDFCNDAEAAFAERDVIKKKKCELIPS